MDFAQALASADSTDLLEAFIHKFNGVIEESDDQAGQINILNSQLDGYKRQCHAQTEEIQKLKEENQFFRDMALKAENIANQSSGLQQELARAKATIKSLSEQLKELNQLNPKKLKEQNKRQQQKAIEKDKRIKQAELALKDAGKALKDSKAETQQAIAKIAELKKQLAHDTGSGLYHNGEHHLIIWPQKTKMQDSEGRIFEGRSLLYLHQSGRGGLITYNPETNQANLCAAPKGGLRPSAECREFATDWLYKINEIQEGIVKEEDMMPVNYNGADF